MILNLAVLNLAEMIERFAYYGMRAILILFLVSGLAWDRMDAADLYGTFTMAIYFATLLGGVLADLTRKPVLVAIIGNSMTSAGIFLLAFSGSVPSVYIAACTMAIGSGLFKPSIVVSLYRVSFTQKHRLDLIMTIFYLVINLGAFAGPLVVGLFGDTGNPADFRTGFLIAGGFSLLPTVLLAVSYKNLVFNDLLYDAQTYKSSEIGITNVVLWFVLPIVFWLAYELFPVFIGSPGNSSAHITMLLIGLVFYLVMIPLHLIRNFRSALKISVGLAMVAFACIVLPTLDFPPFSGFILLAIAEVMIVPVLWSQLIQQVSPRFTGMIMSLLMFTTVGINKVAGTLYDTSASDQPAVLYILGIFCSLLLVAFLVLDHYQKKREQQFPQQLF